MQTTNIVDIVTANLENHQNATRIKKLVFCACKQKWENDINRLGQYPLKGLIQELHRNSPTIDDLKKTLDKIIQNLNRSAQYALVANIIISELGNLYNDSEESTQIIFIQPNEFDSAVESDAQLNKLANLLAQDENSLRIKKLMFCACRHRWENDSQVLNSFQFKYLIQELREAHVTLEQLSETLYGIVETLNRQGVYSTVANTIISTLQTLYPTTEESTGILKAPQRPSTPAVEADFAQTVPPQETPGLSPAHRSYDAFNCRLEVMKYTNPLRAKVLLFSLLYHPFNASKQDWAIIKTHELDDLLYHFFQRCPTVFDFETKLYDMAKRLENPYESTQAASAIAQSIKPYYANC